MKKLSKKSKAVLLSAPLAALALVALVVVDPAAAQSIEDGVNIIDNQGPNSLEDVIKTVVSTALYIIGALSVIMLIWGGIRYVISGGNSNQVTAAKNTILYAIIGIVVAVLALTIVQFVLDRLI